MRPITIRIKKKQLRAWKMICLGLAVLALLFLTDQRMRPMVETITSYQAQLFATRAINEAVMEVIAQENAAYGSIISISQGQDGLVSSLSTDMVTINHLKARITEQVSDRLQNNPNNTILIPLGTLLGEDLLSGRGPMVSVKVLPVGAVSTDFYNEFSEAGINQTLHQIMLLVQADISAIMPFYNIETKVNTNICIAQTVIVGKVPSAYTDINGDISTLLDQFNNYGVSKNPVA